MNSTLTRCRALTFATAVGTCVLALSAAPLRAQQNVSATYTVGGTDCTQTSKMDPGATGEGATELSRAAATACGLLNGTGDPVMANFEPDPADPTKPKKNSYTMADGSSVDYALTKPIKICIKDSNNNECCATIRLTVVCDKTKTGSNLMGKAWLTAVKATWVFESDKLTWPRPAPPPGDKKSKDLEEETSNATDASYDGHQYQLFHGGNFLPIFGALSSIPFTIVPPSVALSLGLIPNGQIDISDDDDLIAQMIKNGFTSFASSFVYDTAVIDFIEFSTPQGLVHMENVPVVINDMPFDFLVVGHDVLAAHDAEINFEVNTVSYGEPPMDFPWIKFPGTGKPGTAAIEPDLLGSGPMTTGSLNQVDLLHAQANSLMLLVAGLSPLVLPLKGGILVPAPDLITNLPTGPSGALTLPFVVPPGLNGLQLFLQGWFPDPAASFGLSATDGVKTTVQ